MNRKPTADENGFALVETLIVMAVIGILASIAISNYAKNREQARAATCLANRRTIEHDEAAFYAQNQTASLVINDAYRCPDGGTYLWLVSDPEDPGYPKVGCSIHYAGGLAAAEPSPAGETAETTPEETTDTTQDETKQATPDDALTRLKDDVYRMSLPRVTELQLVNMLDQSLRQFEKAKYDNAAKMLDQFKKMVDKNKNLIDDADEDYLVSKAEEIQDALKKL